MHVSAIERDDRDDVEANDDDADEEDAGEVMFPRKRGKSLQEDKQCHVCSGHCAFRGRAADQRERDAMRMRILNERGPCRVRFRRLIAKDIQERDARSASTRPRRHLARPRTHLVGNL